MCVPLLRHNAMHIQTNLQIESYRVQAGQIYFIVLSYSWAVRADAVLVYLVSKIM